MLILLIASCVIWIAGISLAVVGFLGGSVTFGWLVAGMMLVSLLVWFAIMVAEFRNAIELPEENPGANFEIMKWAEGGYFNVDTSDSRMTKAPRCHRNPGAHRGVTRHQRAIRPGVFPLTKSISSK